MENTLKILLLEDSESDAELICRFLKKAGISFVHERVEARDPYVKALRIFEPDIVLSDHSLPQFNSMDALKICKQERAMIPFILVTGTVSEEFAVECLQAGADDYILKGKLTRLPSAIVSALLKKKTEQEKNIAVEIIRKSEEYFRGLIENSSDIFAIIDAKNRIEYLSPSIKKILGFEIEDLKGKILEEFVHPEDRIITRAIPKLLSNEKEELSVSEFRFIHKDQRWRYLECVSKADTMKQFLIVNIRDITERKQAEQELKSKNIELEKINKELDSFVYSASHDLRAPLKSVLGLVSLAKMEFQMNNYSSLNKYSNLIEKSISRLDDTIEKIVNYSLNARSEVNYERIDFNDIIQTVMDRFSYLPENEKIKTDIQLDKQKEFTSDKDRIFIIFNNLISNSIKYCSSNGDILINVQVKVSPTEAIITISDNGVGIEKESMDKIFNMFYRANERSDGSGLGLFVVKEIVEKLNGKINVTSVVNKGTTFEIKLPNK